MQTNENDFGDDNRFKKYIFVTGGVISSVGKGVITASIAGLLSRSYGLRVKIAKLDPYLNYDAGTMNPFQHGEVYVTEDGCETDLDLGYYERFSGIEVDKWSNITGGKIMKRVIENEREGKYLGDTVQINKQVVDEVLKFIKHGMTDKNEKKHKYDIVICEIGGSADDLEARWFIEASRRLCHEAFHIHVCHLPYIKMAKELKTRPTQRSVSFLRGLGINIDLLICRSDKGVVLGDNEIKKLTTFCGLGKKQIISCPDVDSIYTVPMHLYKEGIINLFKRFGVCGDKFFNKFNGNDWLKLEKREKNAVSTVRVAIVGKYIPMDDAYKSLLEALKSAGQWIGKKVEIAWVDARKICSEIADGSGDEKCFINDGTLSYESRAVIERELKNVSAVVVAGGFGVDAVLGKTLVLTYCRLANLPLLGICLGMQLMAIEYCNNLCGASVTSEEFNGKFLGKNGVGKRLVKIMRKSVKLGGSMRLGGKKVKMLGDKKELVRSLYGGADEIVERHRHRYDVDGKKFTDYCRMAGGVMSVVGESDGIPEIICLRGHRFYVGVQFHPEFKSSPFKPHPLFIGLLKSRDV